MDAKLKDPTADFAPLKAVEYSIQPVSAIPSYRMLCIGETWYGSDARAAFAALRRLGHSVQVIDQNNYVPLQWQMTLSKGIRKIFRPLFVKELMLDTQRALSRFKPHCLFVFKGNWVHPDVIEFCRQRGVATVNYYPDVSFLSHGSYIPRALPRYDHVFNTKTYGVGDMKSQLGIRNVSFLAPGYDPELHRPVELSEEEQCIYGCDVAFIGTWSPKKEAALTKLRGALPNVNLKIWGFQWEKSSASNLRQCIMGDGVTGDEYSRAICGSAICLGLLSEQGRGSSSGDLITARTFQIPACGTLMLHERNDEVLQYFTEDQDAAFFSTPAELALKVEHYLAHPQERARVAHNGRQRSLRDEYSIDGRMRTVIRWLEARSAKTA
jgi:spore maturation protein CgeB